MRRFICVYVIAIAGSLGLGCAPGGGASQDPTVVEGVFTHDEGKTDLAKVLFTCSFDGCSCVASSIDISHMGTYASCASINTVAQDDKMAACAALCEQAGTKIDPTLPAFDMQVACEATDKICQ